MQTADTVERTMDMFSKNIKINAVEPVTSSWYAFFFFFSEPIGFTRLRSNLQYEGLEGIQNPDQSLELCVVRACQTSPSKVTHSQLDTDIAEGKISQISDWQIWTASPA